MLLAALENPNAEVLNHRQARVIIEAQLSRVILSDLKPMRVLELENA
jgi:hypothetical protein